MKKKTLSLALLLSVFLTGCYTSNQMIVSGNRTNGKNKSKASAEAIPTVVECQFPCRCTSIK